MVPNVVPRLSSRRLNGIVNESVLNLLYLSTKCHLEYCFTSNMWPHCTSKMVLKGPQFTMAPTLVNALWQIWVPSCGYSCCSINLQNLAVDLRAQCLVWKVQSSVLSLHGRFKPQCLPYKEGTELRVLIAERLTQGSELLWALDIFTQQTRQQKAGQVLEWGKVWTSKTVKACRATAATCRVQLGM